MSIGLTLSQFEDVATIHAVQINGEIVWIKNNRHYPLDIPERLMDIDIQEVVPYVEVSVCDEYEDRSATVKARLEVVLYDQEIDEEDSE